MYAAGLGAGALDGIKSIWKWRYAKRGCIYKGFML